MLKIQNKAKLPYKIIGQVIDHYMNNGKEETFYVGKKDIIKFEYKNKGYEADIEYTENSVYWSFFGIYKIKYEE